MAVSLRRRPAVVVRRRGRSGVDAGRTDPQAIAADFGQARVPGAVVEGGRLAVGGGGVGAQLVELLILALVLTPLFPETCRQGQEHIKHKNRAVTNALTK